MAFSLLQNEDPRGTPLRFVLATHPDEDHCVGIPGLMRLCMPLRRIEAFYHCGASRKKRRGRGAQLLDAVAVAEDFVRQGKVDVAKPVKAGDLISWDPPVPGLSIRVLNPAGDSVPRGPICYGESNDASVSLLVVFGDVSILLAGDIEGTAWARVIAHQEFRPPNILKVPHHGALNGIPPVGALAHSGDTCWALLSTDSGVADKPYRDTLQEFWRRPNWRTRCTGLSPCCDVSNGERYPVPPEKHTYPNDLREMLEFSRRRASIFVEYETLLGCCVNNEIVVTDKGEIIHSAGSKTCDVRN